MQIQQIVILVALIGYAIYRQSHRHEVIGGSRFKLAIIYGIVGLVVGGFAVPAGPWAVGFLVASIALSVIVGVIRGKYTKVWREDGRVYSQGTALTISLFLILVLGKFAMGTAAYFLHISDNGGFGEIMLMIALMVAFQAQIIWNRAKPLGARQRSSDPVGDDASAPQQVLQHH
ncbi:MAG: DUF1453 domain-containing protein [Nakamurella sp.]